MLNSSLESEGVWLKTGGQHLKNTAQGVRCARNHCSAVLGALEKTARACFVAAQHSKSLLEQAFLYSTTIENATPALFFRTLCWKSLHGRAWLPHCARNHLKGVLRSHVALEIAALTSFFVFDSTFVFPSKSISTSLCFELCIASSCALCSFTSTIRWHMRI